MIYLNQVFFFIVWAIPKNTLIETSHILTLNYIYIFLLLAGLVVSND